jgi:hypothetical protein
MGAGPTDRPATVEQKERGPESPGTLRGVLRHALYTAKVIEQSTFQAMARRVRSAYYLSPMETEYMWCCLPGPSWRHPRRIISPSWSKKALNARPHRKVYADQVRLHHYA